MKDWEEDVDVRSAVDWFLSYFEAGEWERRRVSAEDYLRSLSDVNPVPGRRLTGDQIRVAPDLFAWYLTLAETYLTRPEEYDHTQGARVIPIFSILGRDIALLKQIQGVDERVRRMVSNKGESPDSGLFELLVGGAYARNGWSEIAFVPESPHQKTPDLSVRKKVGRKRFIECKRLSMVSGYHRDEHKRWLNMWPPLSEYLRRLEMPLLLEIIFHVELRHLDEEFLSRELLPKLRLIVRPGVIIDNDVWAVAVSVIDLDDVREKLRAQYYKVNSSSLCFLLTGEDLRYNKQFTSLIEASFEGKYVDDIRFAAGAVWSCDAEAAIRTKARDIRAQLSRAITQLPAGEHGIVHVGLETLEGYRVERERMQRIANTVFNFNTLGKKVDWIYCHLLGASVPPDRNWLFDETVFTFPRDRRLIPPLKPPFLVASDEETFRRGVHWV
jgi:hypothetical protein